MFIRTFLHNDISCGQLNMQLIESHDDKVVKDGERRQRQRRLTGGEGEEGSG